MQLWGIHDLIRCNRCLPQIRTLSADFIDVMTTMYFLYACEEKGLISCAANLPVQGEVKSAAGRWLNATAPALARRGP